MYEVSSRQVHAGVRAGAVHHFMFHLRLTTKVTKYWTEYLLFYCSVLFEMSACAKFLLNKCVWFDILHPNVVHTKRISNI